MLPEPLRFQVLIDIDGKQEWRDCIDVPGVRLPRGYYFGTSSVTGDLSGTAVWPQEVFAEQLLCSFGCLEVQLRCGGAYRAPEDLSLLEGTLFFVLGSVLCSSGSFP